MICLLALRCVPFLIIKGGWPGGEAESAAAFSLIAVQRGGVLFKERVKLISKLYLVLRGVVSGESNALFDTSGTYIYRSWVGSPERVLEAEAMLSKSMVDVYSMSEILGKALRIVEDSKRTISCLGVLPAQCWKWICEEKILESDSPLGVDIPEGLPYSTACLNLERFSRSIEKLRGEIPFLRGALASIHSIKVSWGIRIDEELGSLRSMYRRGLRGRVKTKIETLLRERKVVFELFERLESTIRRMIRVRESLLSDAKHGVTEFTVVRIPFYVALLERKGQERFVVIPPVGVYTRDEILELGRKPIVMLTPRHEFCKLLGSVIHEELSGKGTLRTWIRLNMDRIEIRSRIIRSMVMEGMETLERLGIVSKKLDRMVLSLFKGS